MHRPHPAFSGESEELEAIRDESLVGHAIHDTTHVSSFGYGRAPRILRSEKRYGWRID
jgi:hypothetical protein